MDRNGVDKHVIEDFIGGSQRAFSTIFHSYNRLVVGFARRFFRSDAAADDLAQDIWTTVWEHREQFRNARNFESYFWGVVWKKAHDRQRTLIRHDQILQRYLKEKAAPVDNDLEHHFTNEDYNLIIKQALVSNTKRQQKIFNLSRIQGLSRTEIARQLDLAQSTVDNDLTSALSAVRGYFNSRFTSVILPLLLSIFC